MGRQQNFYSRAREQQQHLDKNVHPVWRGVGFLLLIIIPAISFLATLILLDENARQGWVAIPTNYLSPWLDPLLFIKIGMTIAIAFVLYTITLLITFLANSLAGAPRYGPLDAPPIKAKIRKRSR